MERSSLRNVESISDMPKDRRSSYNRYSPPPPPAGFAEMPAEMSESRTETPTEARPGTNQSQQVGGLNLDFSGRSDKQNGDYADSLRSPISARTPGFPGAPDGQPSQLPPAPGPKPASYMSQKMPDQPAPPPLPQQQQQGDLSSLPSQQRQSEEQPSSAPGTGLRIANPSADSDEEWQKEALGYMSYAGRRHVS